MDSKLTKEILKEKSKITLFRLHMCKENKTADFILRKQYIVKDLLRDSSLIHSLQLDLPNKL